MKKELKQYLSKKNLEKNTKIEIFPNFFRNSLAVDMFRDTLPPQLLVRIKYQCFFL